MVPYFKGFHLSLESWRDGRDSEGWKLSKTSAKEEEEYFQERDEDEDDLLIIEKEEGQVQQLNFGEDLVREPPSGVVEAVPRFVHDLEALLLLTDSDDPPSRPVRTKDIFFAVYGFVDAAKGGFGGSLEMQQRNFAPPVHLESGVKIRIGNWLPDEEDTSSNFKEGTNLVETVEEESASGKLHHAEVYICTDNSTFELAFHKGSSTSKLIHELVVRLRKCERDASLILRVIHVAGTRMIEQGTDGLSRGTLTEGIMAGNTMEFYIGMLEKTALQRYPELESWIKSWSSFNELIFLKTEDWFDKAHSITGGNKDANGVWIPEHRNVSCTFVWTPPRQ